MTEDELNLTATLRQMDQLIFRMSQCSSWEQMRPFFIELNEGTRRRMLEESNRIRMLMVPEIVRTYAKPSPTSKPESLRLEGPNDAGGQGLSDAKRREDSDS